MTILLALAVSCGLIIAAFATVSPFAGLLSAGLLGLGVTIAYVRGSWAAAGRSETPAEQRL